MPYLLAAHANDAAYMPSLLFALGPVLRPPTSGEEHETWGVGYYADHRPLIIKKPSEILTERTVYELARDVKSRTLVASAQSGATRDHAPPYRFRRWLFTYTGSIEPLAELQGAVAEKLPDFLRTELGSGTAGELMFAMVLAELHRAGLTEGPLAEPHAVHAAASRAAETIRGLSAEAPSGPVEGGMVITAGRSLHVFALGAPLYWKIQVGLERLPEGPPDPALNDFQRVAHDLKRFKAVVVARHIESGAADWSRLDDASLRVGPDLAVDRIVS